MSTESTLLFSEQNPELINLRNALAPLKITLEAAYPITTLIESLVAKYPLIAVIYDSKDGLIYSAEESGTRQIERLDLEDEESIIRDVVKQKFELLPNAKFALTNLEDGDFALDLDGAREPSHPFSLKNLLEGAQTVKLPRLANLLPKKMSIPVDFIAKTFGVILLVISVAIAATYWKDVQAASQKQQDIQIQEQSASRTLNVLLENKAKIDEARAYIAEASPGKIHKAKLLEAIGNNRPTAITIRNITIQDSSFTITGLIHEKDTAPLQPFLNALAKAGPWRIKADRPNYNKGTDSSDFTIAGNFN